MSLSYVRRPPAQQKRREETFTKEDIADVLLTVYLEGLGGAKINRIFAEYDIDADSLSALEFSRRMTFTDLGIIIN